MDLTPVTAIEDHRRQVTDFLRANLPAAWRGIGALPADERRDFCVQWREVLRTEGYLGISWPKEYGGAGLGLLEESVVQEEFVRAGAPLLPMATDSSGFQLIGPTILHSGTEEQKRRFLPAIISGEDRWCQGYSEPDAGSDLFALRTRAVLDGDEWIVDGQKVWQTAGHDANWIFALVRTEPTAPKAKGLSLMLIPMEQPGVLVRPIRTMTGADEFCEVFFTEARTSAEHVVGAVNDGARVALTLLGYERGASSGALHASYQIELERLVELAREHGCDTDPQIRQRLAWCYSKTEILKYLGLRTLTRASRGEAPGPESSIIKLYESEYHTVATQLALDILGMHGSASTGAPATADLGPDPLGGPNSAAAWQHVFMTSRAATIYGGSSQIQRNTLGERVLGLAREPKVPGPT